MTAPAEEKTESELAEEERKRQEEMHEARDAAFEIALEMEREKLARLEAAKAAHREHPARTAQDAHGTGALRGSGALRAPVVRCLRRVVLLRLPGMPVRRKPVAWVRCRRSTPRSVRPTRALGALSERDGRNLPTFSLLPVLFTRGMARGAPAGRQGTAGH